MGWMTICEDSLRLPATLPFPIRGMASLDATDPSDPRSRSDGSAYHGWESVL
jgi:hypothetical protein